MWQWALTRLTDFTGWPTLGRVMALVVALGLAVTAGVVWHSDQRGPIVAEGARKPAPQAEPARQATRAPYRPALTAAADIDPAREAKRFARVDKDKDNSVSRDEFLALRRRAFAKLDSNGDGVLSFEEAAIKTIARFAGADADGNNRLTAQEFAGTAAKRRAVEEN